MESVQAWLGEVELGERLRKVIGVITSEVRSIRRRALVRSAKFR